MLVLVPMLYADLRARGLSDACIVRAIRGWFRAARRSEGEFMAVYQITGAEAALLYLYARYHQRRKRKPTQRSGGP